MSNISTEQRLIALENAVRELKAVRQIAGMNVKYHIIEAPVFELHSTSAQQNISRQLRYIPQNTTDNLISFQAQVEIIKDYGSMEVQTSSGNYVFYLSECYTEWQTENDGSFFLTIGAKGVYSRVKIIAQGTCGGKFEIV